MRKLLFLFMFSLFLKSLTAQLSFNTNGQYINKLRGNNVELGDFNNDGYPDAFVVNINSKDGEGYRVYLNDGKGQFTDNGQKLIYIADIAYNAAIGDINGDGNLEVITGSNIWLNNGKGQFEASQEKIAFADTSKVLDIIVKLSDLNKDGYLDLFCSIVGATSSIRIYLNDGKGHFSDTGQRFGGGVNARAILGDIDGNGSIDAITAGWKSNTLPFPNGTDYCPNRIWINDGKGNFKESDQILDEGTRHVHDIKLGDVNGDGKLDMVMGMTSYPFLKVFINDGTGHFNSIQSFGNVWVNSFDLGDLNDDGKLDLFVVSGDCYDQPTPLPGQAWLNDGTGQFFDSKLRLGNSLSSDIKLGDFNGDKKLDAFVVNWYWDNINNVQKGSPAEIWLNTSQILIDSKNK